MCVSGWVSLYCYLGRFSVQHVGLCTFQWQLRLLGRLAWIRVIFLSSLDQENDDYNYYHHDYYPYK